MTQTIFLPYLLLQLIPRCQLRLQPLLGLLETLPEELVLHLSTVEAHLPLICYLRESERAVRKLGEQGGSLPSLALYAQFHSVNRIPDVQP